MGESYAEGQSEHNHKPTEDWGKRLQGQKL